MRTWWAWTFILALGVFPVSAQARERGRGGEARERHSSPRQTERRGERRSERAERSDHRDSRRDSGRGGYSRRDDRSGDRGSRQAWTGWNRGRRDSHERRGSYRGAPSRGWQANGFRPRHPSHYRYGYVHRHGYYYPRYFFDVGFYPAHGSIRIQVEPSEAEVYVDGYFAGIVDDFDGIFQRLDVAPGPHEIAVRLDGFRTWSAQVYAVPGETVKIHCHLLPGPSGEAPVYDDRGDVGGYDAPAPGER